MAYFMKDVEHLEIQLEEIISATNNFDVSKVIGVGGFGKVYAAQLSHSQSEEKSLAAIKRLDPRFGQGGPEFFKEIRMLSCYRHENLISLLGYCNQGGEMILVYEHAPGGSLDRLLNSVSLTWTQRIKVCLDAAKGLSFLHDPNGTQQRVLHCDVKSANILLDENLNAKVSDFGLSKMGPADQQYSVLVTNIVGTHGYCDPLYMETYQLTKESDVYSFGVVLFEVLCGRQCIESRNGQLNVFVPFWKKTYEDKNLEGIVLRDLKKQMDQSSLNTYADIAYQCLKRVREERPSMSLVVKNLEKALEVQERYDFILKIPKEYVQIANAAVDPLFYNSLEELKKLLSKGVLLNTGKTWFCINEKEEHIERIYIESCLKLDEIEARSLERPSDYGDFVNSRYPKGRCYKYQKNGFKARVRGQYLTPQISYTLNLVFRFSSRYQKNVNTYNPLIYKLDGDNETKVLMMNQTHMREGGWLLAPLHQFKSQDTTSELQFIFEESRSTLVVAGFEFQPLEEKTSTQVTVELHNNQVSEEYKDIVKDASQSLVYESLEELQQHLSIGVHLNGYKRWFSLNKKGERCEMISMEDCLISDEDFPSIYKSDCRSRFPAGLYQTNKRGFKTHVKTQLLSPSTIYTVQLVFDNFSLNRGEQVYVDLKYRLTGETTTSTVYLANLRKDDGLLMAELYQFTSDGSIFDLKISFENHGTNIGVEGILFQPLEIVEDQLLQDEKVDDMQSRPDSDSDAYWDQKIPNDYERFLEGSKDSVNWKTKKELYSILCKGFLYNGHLWCSIDKNGKKCPMVREVLILGNGKSTWKSSKESRFGEVLVITADDKYEISGVLNPAGLSPHTKYACYFVYKLPPDQSAFEAPLEVDRYDWYNRRAYVYLISQNTPFIGPKCDVHTHNRLNRYKVEAIPQHRCDGWMEVKIWYLTLTVTTKIVTMHLELKHPCDKYLSGLMVQGIEFRPV